MLKAGRPAQRGAAGKFAHDERDGALQDLWAVHDAVRSGSAAQAQSATSDPADGTGNAYDIVTLEAGGAASVAFSPDESRIYVARYDGKLDVFDSATLVKLATWDIGSSLGALSVSADGSFLLVVESGNPPYQPGGPPPPPQPTSSTFYRVDTATGAATSFTKAGGPYLDVEIVDGSTAILSGGQQEVQKFDLATGSYTSLPNAVHYSNNSVLVEDEHYTLFAEGGISNGPLMLYDDRTGTIVAAGDNYQTIGTGSGSTGFNFGHQAISEAGGLVAQFAYHGTINLFDLDLNFIRGFQISGPTDGIAFDSTGRFLFTRTDAQFSKIDVATGAVVDSFTVGNASWHNNPGSGDQIVLSADGKTILVKDNSAGLLQLIDLRIRDELFEGTADADSFAGGKGDDTYIVNHEDDTIVELIDEGTDLAIASVDYTIEAYVENLSLTGAAAEGRGNALANRIEGSEGANQLYGMAGDDMISGEGGNDVLDGGEGVDVLDGGEGDDYFFANGEGDRFDGGSGSDSIGYGQATGAVTVTLALVAGEAGSGPGGDQLRNIENVFGTTLGDTLTGNGEANLLQGHAGNDILTGNGGNDRLLGDFGDDMMTGGSGDDQFSVHDAGDQVFEAADEGQDQLFASVTYTLAAGQHVERLVLFGDPAASLGLTGNELANALVGNDGNNALNGGGGNDVLEGLGGQDSMAGGTGDDSYYVENAGDTVTELADEGDDFVVASVSYALGADQSVERLYAAHIPGTTINLTGSNFANMLVGNNGANVLDGRGGADIMNGSLGGDTYIVDNAGDVVTEAFGSDADIVYSSVSYTLAENTGVESLSTLSWQATDALNLTGNGLANTLIGNAGKNVLNGGAGADMMIGREGDDTYFVDSFSDRPTEYAGQGTDIVYTSISYALAANSDVESLSTISWQATTALNLFGNGLNNTLIGNAGVNQLNGGGGNDVMIGREGNDVYFVDSALDRPTESAGQGSDIVYTSVSYTLASNSDVESLATISFDATTALNLTGNHLANTLIGNDGANQLDGGAGADVMVGRAGNDKYLVDNAGDKVFEAAGGGQDVVFTGVSVALTNDQEIEGMSSIDWNATYALNLTGNSLRNNLIGNAGVNILDGKAGNDSLQGREGADTYAFTTMLGAQNIDLILGFSSADDTIWLENNGVFTGLAAGALPASAFVIGTAAQDLDDRIVYNQATGQLFFDADGSGAGAQVQFARLDGAPIIAANDFTVI